jgi:hypothetical protein
MRERTLMLRALRRAGEVGPRNWRPNRRASAEGAGYQNFIRDRAFAALYTASLAWPPVAEARRDFLRYTARTRMRLPAGSLRLVIVQHFRKLVRVAVFEP